MGTAGSAGWLGRQMVDKEVSSPAWSNKQIRVRVTEASGDQSHLTR